MVRLYADEQFPYEVVEHLRNFGHDILTVQEAGNAIIAVFIKVRYGQSLINKGLKPLACTSYDCTPL